MFFILTALQFVCMFVLSQSALSLQDDDSSSLQYTLNAVNLECDGATPDLWIIQEQVRDYIKWSTEMVFSQDLVLYPPNLSTSFAKSIVDYWKQFFPAQNLDECLRIVDKLEHSILNLNIVEPDEFGSMIIYDYDLIDVDMSLVIYETRPCFAAVMEGFLSNAKTCMEKSIDALFSNLVKQEEEEEQMKIQQL